MTKSFVTIEQKQCPVCGKVFDSGSLLMDKRVRDRFERSTVTGYALCDDDKKKFNDGYIALIEAEQPAQGNTLTIETAVRKGRIAHMRTHVLQELLGDPQAGLTVTGERIPISFVSPEFMDKLVELAGGAMEESP